MTGGIIWSVSRLARVSEPRSRDESGSGSAFVAEAPAAPVLPATPSASPAASNKPPDSATAYPVDLEELRVRLPDNRYWDLAAPTSDPAVAKVRAERARRNNELFGRTQTGEATEPEIRAYYAEQRRVSEDYLRLSVVVLAEKGDELPERDRGMFELSAQLHRARLKQIERDLTDALARRRERAP